MRTTMQQTGSTGELPRDVPPREPFLRWLGANVMRLVIYLGAASVVLGLVMTLGDRYIKGIDEGFGWTIVFFLYGALFGIPGTTVWLLIVSRLPTEWSIRNRRLVALATTPLIQIILLLTFLDWGFTRAVLIVGLLLPAGSAFVVRLRERRQSSPFPPEGPLPQPFVTSTG